MDTLVLTNKQGKDVTTSLIIAEVFEKDHDKVCRDIRNLSCSQEFRAANFGDSSYISSQGKQLPMYEMTKDGFSFLVMGYTGPRAGEFKERFINEFNKREALLKNNDYIIGRAMSILHDRTKILEQQVMQKDEQIQIQEEVIKQAIPKTEYFDDVLQSDSLIATNVIAKDLGLSAVSLNRILHQKGIIYNSSGTWVLYARYQDMGYTRTKTHIYTDNNGKECTSVQTYWTEKGRRFIFSLFSARPVSKPGKQKSKMQTGC